MKSQLIRKDPDAEKDWRQEEKGMTEDEMFGWHLWLNGHEFEQAWGVGDGQGSLACCSPWGGKESDMTEGLNNNNKKLTLKTYLPQLFLPNTLCLVFNQKLQGILKGIKKVWRDKTSIRTRRG